MGLIADTGVFILIERRKSGIYPRQVLGNTEFAISAVTVSELLVGAMRANTQARRDHRLAIVDSIIASSPVHPVTIVTARVHAPLHADLQARGLLIGAHDLMIAATAIEHGHGVLTTNRREFERVPGLQVVDFPIAP